MLTIALSRHRVRRAPRRDRGRAPRRRASSRSTSSWTSTSAAAERSDRLADTVDYSRVAEVIVGDRRRASRTTCSSRWRAGCDAVREPFPARARRAARAAQAEPADLPRAPRLRGGPDRPRPTSRAPRLDVSARTRASMRVVAVVDVDGRADGDADVQHRQRDAAAVGEAGGAGHAAGLRLGVALERVAGRRDRRRRRRRGRPAAS